MVTLLGAVYMLLTGVGCSLCSPRVSSRSLSIPDSILGVDGSCRSNSKCIKSDMEADREQFAPYIPLWVHLAAPLHLHCVLPGELLVQVAWVICLARWLCAATGLARPFPRKVVVVVVVLASAPAAVRASVTCTFTLR